ncbi:HEPN domain-containing protein [Candidatus Woesearchaeota archaeon]|nr:HEPN domain-containing protein [Candidatus Woesearchaeota archaeon]
MSHARNKVEWCLKKAGRELNESGKHRGLVTTTPDLEKAKEHIAKAEHYLKATMYLKEGNFSDIAASTAFYSAYHCLLAIASRCGYESGNQECTFALMFYLIEKGTISFPKGLLDKISFLGRQEGAKDKTITQLREQFQYGTTLSLEENLYDELLSNTKEIIAAAKLILK